MSLLLDALKRAEQEKLARQSDRGAPQSEAPAAAPPARGAAVFELQPLHSPAPPAGAAKGEAANSQSVFRAKTPGEPARKRGLLLAVAGALAVIAIGVGAYAWYVLHVLAPAPLVMRAGAVATPAPLAPPTAAALAPPVSAPSDTPSVAPAAPAKPQSAPSEARKALEPSEAADRMLTQLLNETAAPAPPVKLARTLEAPRVSAQVSAAFEALRSGDLAAARRSYLAAERSDGVSVDSQLGLATVEARSGNRAAAVGHYRKALELDSRNATALAGLASLADYSRPEALEGQLRGDVANHPQSAALRLALGNLYASQSRWSEAQAAFFEALRLEPTNADILYNLAVSLDNLGQARIAADFYRRALEAAAVQAAQFDAAAVERRLAQLK
ncbi:MAG TPA: tetratricopeptide repeat protein [Usitatibacter sp.]|nr:tetratricopeptide repeat protein [Usitatibacter sp.]